MEHIRLPSSLILIWELRRSIERNQSIHIGIQYFLDKKIQNDELSERIKEFYAGLRTSIGEQNTHHGHNTGKKMTPTERLLFNIVKKGLQGIPIYDLLVELDQFMTNSCEEDIQKHIVLLPMLMQIPLLGLLFPAILILVIIPALGLLQF